MSSKAHLLLFYSFEIGGYEILVVVHFWGFRATHYDRDRNTVFDQSFHRHFFHLVCFLVHRSIINWSIDQSMPMSFDRIQPVIDRLLSYPSWMIAVKLVTDLIDFNGLPYLGEQTLGPCVRTLTLKLVVACFFPHTCNIKLRTTPLLCIRYAPRFFFFPRQQSRWAFLSLSLSLFLFFETKPFLLAFTQKHKDFLKVRQTKPPQSNFNSLEILGSSDFQH